MPHLRLMATLIASLTIFLTSPDRSLAGMTTADGRHPIDRIEVTVVYFVPRDRVPLPDWRDRVDYFCRRIEAFHQREFGDQSTLTTRVLEEPFVSDQTTARLRANDGSGDGVFFRTLREVDRRLEFATGERTAYPILLVLSEINRLPLDDFYRVRPTAEGLEFEGYYSRSEHFPGAASGGARATYLADPGKGWGLVSADGWRIPYRGSDCVVYHEGVGHTVGLGHPQPGNESVMSLGQYHGWISESFVDPAQKAELNWRPPETPDDREGNLFDAFRAIPSPKVPRPGQPVTLALDWPRDARLASLRLRYQTSVYGPWIDVAVPQTGSPPESISLGAFDRPTPISYRIDAELQDGQSAEIWGYLQVRSDPGSPVLPLQPLVDLLSDSTTGSPSLTLPPVSREVDLLAEIDPRRDQVTGQWTRDDSRLIAPKQFGARLELPGDIPPAYQLTIIAEPLDEPDALIIGHILGNSRFLTLLNYTPGPVDRALSAIENVDGRNVGNETTIEQPLLKTGRLSHIVCTIRNQSVVVDVDGRRVFDWSGEPSRLSLSDYWKTPNDRLFIGAYNCGYRFHRITLLPLD